MTFLTSTFNRYKPLVEILIARRKLLFNLHSYQKKYPFVQFAPVLKSNAYGHGLVQVASVLDQEKIPFFVVDSLFEATVLRRAGIKSKILEIGYVRPNDIASSRIPNVAFTVTSLEQLVQINSLAKKKISLHLKVDTGMHRQGVLRMEIEAAARILMKNSNLVLTGVASHFADADGKNEKFTRQQIKIWHEVCEFFREKFKRIEYFHLANSAGAKFSNLISANVVRLGIGLYDSVLEMKSIVGSVREIGAGENVGYNLTFKSKVPMKVATVPVGYYEGVDRRLSNLGSFMVGKVVCPIVGWVSMNMTVIDVSKMPKIKMLDSVTVISANKKDPNSVANMANAAKTIPYEILVHIPAQLRRVII